MALSPPEGLGERGGALWRQLTTGRNWDAPGLVLLTEACRIVDRLEGLDRLLRGDVDTWARVVGGEGGVLVLRVDAALSEARQQAGALRQILGQLRLGAVTVPGVPASPEAEGSAVVDELTSRRAGRGAATSDPGGATGV